MVELEFLIELFPFYFRIGTGDDAGAGDEVRCRSFDVAGADGDEALGAGAVAPADGDRVAVAVTRKRLKLFDEGESLLLRRAGEGGSGMESGDEIGVCDVGFERDSAGREEVLHRDGFSRGDGGK